MVRGEDVAKENRIAEARSRTAQTKRNNTRRALLSGAAAEFFTKGYIEASVTEIGKKAKSAATLFNYYESKAVLGLAVVETTYDMIIGNEPGGNSVRARLVALQQSMNYYPGIAAALFEQVISTGQSPSELLPNVYVSIKEGLAAEQQAGTLGTAIAADELAETTMLLTGMPVWTESQESVPTSNQALVLLDILSQS